MNKKNKIKIGAESLLDGLLDSFDGKKAGLITNHSAILSDGTHIADLLTLSKKIKVIAFFGPEHGIRGDTPDGMKISHGEDPVTKIKIFSLYGKTNKPTREMLEGIDVLIFDIQDIGARFYTYISTLFLSLEAAAENNIKFIILDRPNPITGVKVEGPILEKSFRSFVGLYPISIVHGMTVGELSLMVNSEGWLDNGIKADLDIIKMQGWKRDFWFDDTTLEWIKPSPNMSTIKTAAIYPGTCLFEGTNISEGRGTDRPFEIIGAPFIQGEELAGVMNEYNLKGLKFQPVIFKPQEISGITVRPKYASSECQGVLLDVLDRDTLEPVKAIIYLIYTLKKMYPNNFNWKTQSKSTGQYYIDLLMGTDKFRKMIDERKDPEEILKMNNFDLTEFKNIRNKYLLYE